MDTPYRVERSTRTTELSVVNSWVVEDSRDGVVAHCTDANMAYRIAGLLNLSERGSVGSPSHETPTCQPGSRAHP